MQGNSYRLGLMDYKARMYDSYLHRFIQPDTMTPGGPQGLNRYSYVLNDPVNATDPTGHCTGPGNVWIPDGTSYCTGKGEGIAASSDPIITPATPTPTFTPTPFNPTPTITPTPTSTPTMTPTPTPSPTMNPTQIAYVKQLENTPGPDPYNIVRPLIDIFDDGQLNATTGTSLNGQAALNLITIGCFGFTGEFACLGIAAAGPVILPIAHFMNLAHDMITQSGYYYENRPQSPLFPRQYYTPTPFPGTPSYYVTHMPTSTYYP